MTSAMIRVLSESDLVGLVSWEEAVETQRAGFHALEQGEAFLAPRILSPDGRGDTGFVYVSRAAAGAGLTVKAGGVVLSNPSRGVPTVSSIVLAMDPRTGAPLALVHGESVTNTRTVAASILAARVLAPRPAVVAVIGYGAQGRLHAAVIAQLLGPERIVVASSRLTPGQVRPNETFAGSVQEAVAAADLVVTCTTSRTPVVAAGWLKPDACVVSVGSFAPDRREVGDDVVAASRVVVDHVATALEHAGPVRHAVRSGVLDPSRVVALGSLVGDGPGSPGTASRTGSGPDLPTGNSTRTYYNSVGVGVQDAAIVALILERAQARGLGTLVPC